MTRLLGSERRLALAVSGGSDSAALLLIAVRARPLLGLQLHCATVDHGLRPEARAEAEAVGALCAARDVPHQILSWRGAKPSSNLQAAAREARARLLAEWRLSIGTPTLALGHTLDDVAEGFLLRLARGSGVDGLARMAEARVQTEFATMQREDAAPLRLIRPLLGVRRSALQALCRSEGAPWFDDPGNQDDRFARSRARALMAALEPLDLGPERLAKTAASMARARDALEAETAALSRRCVTTEPELGLARLRVDALADAPRELALRLLARVLEWVSGAAYPPRLEPLEAALDAMIAGGEGRSLHGALLAPRRSSGPAAEDGKRGAWLAYREPAAAAADCEIEGAETFWDRRFRLRRTPPEGEAAVRFGALGEAGRLAVESRLEQAGLEPPPSWRKAPIGARRAAPAARDAAGAVIYAPAAGIHCEGLILSPLRPPP